MRNFQQSVIIMLWKRLFANSPPTFARMRRIANIINPSRRSNGWIFFSNWSTRSGVMMKLPSDLHAFIESLNAAHVKYVSVGGYAVAFHGRPRFTGDIDLFIEASLDNAVKVVQALRHFGLGGLELDPCALAAKDVVVQLGFPPNQIDLMTSIDGVAFNEAWRTRISALIGGLPTAFIAKGLLITNKRRAGRPKNIADADEPS